MTNPKDKGFHSKSEMRRIEAQMSPLERLLAKAREPFDQIAVDNLACEAAGVKREGLDQYSSSAESRALFDDPRRKIKFFTLGARAQHADDQRLFMRHTDKSPGRR